MTAPIIYSLDNATDKERAFWERTIKDKVQKPEDFKEAQKIILEYGALEKSLSLAKNYRDQAVKALEKLPSSTFKDPLISLADYTIHRNR